MVRRVVPTIVVVCGAILGPRAARGQAHQELLIGRDGENRLVARFDAKPFPLSASRFPGVEGYADGVPGFMSVIEPRPADGLFPLDHGANIAFELVGGDAGATVWNDHGTAPMKVGEVFSLGAPPFDSHPVWNIVRGEAGKSFALRLKVRDLSGRYAESEVVSPAFAPDDAVERYRCPMNCEGTDRFYAAPGTCPVCAMRLKLISGRSYRVAVTPGSRPVRAGEQTDLRFQVKAPDGSAVTTLEIVHEKVLHLLMVSEDLSWFAHEHPALQKDGTLTLAYTFPRPGTYVLYHDFTPARVGMQVVPVRIDVEGERPARAALLPDADRAKTIDGHTVRLDTHGTLKSLAMSTLTFTLSMDGKPVTDLEPWLGAMGHVIIVSEDLKQFVHSHPLEGPRGAPGGHGPAVEFRAQFPAPGLYKAWGQFQHKGKVITAPFTFRVRSPLEAPGTEPGP